jgi:hypothetical protein
MRKRLELTRTTCTFCCEHAPLNAKPGPLPQAHLRGPFEMISADVGQLANGHHFIAIADRFSSLVEMYDLVKTGTSSEVINAISKFIHNNSSQLKRIFWDNASNFKSTEIEAWAKKHEIFLEYSAAYHPSGNMFAETNIKRCKRATNDLFENNRSMTCDNIKVQRRIESINNTLVNGGVLTPKEIIFHQRSTQTGYPQNQDLNELDQEFNNGILHQLTARFNGNNKNKPQMCSGLRLEGKDFYLQNRKQPEPDFCSSKSHKAMGIGEDIWFRIFSGSKSGPKWKCGVIIG